MPLRPVTPSRQWQLHCPLAVNVLEWGPADAAPLVLVHGGGDVARTFDDLAGRLAGHGWRVVAADQRGHGDSARAELYGWSAELRDVVALLRALPGGPHPVVGHSKGGVLALDVTAARPELVHAVVAVDGFVRRIFPPQPAHDTAPRWLDQRRDGRRTREQTRAQLAEARHAANPRLDRSWIDHLVSVGARVAGDEGPATDRSTATAARAGDVAWTWKLDPAAFPLPPHAVPHEASLRRLAALRRPALLLKAGVEEPIAGQPPADVLRRHLPPAGRLEVLDGLGHFAHLEDAPRVAALVLRFLADTGARP